MRNLSHIFNTCAEKSNYLAINTNLTYTSSLIHRYPQPNECYLTDRVQLTSLAMRVLTLQKHWRRCVLLLLSSKCYWSETGRCCYTKFDVSSQGHLCCHKYILRPASIDLLCLPESSYTVWSFVPMYRNNASLCYDLFDLVRTWFPALLVCSS